jgi:hypothetical protein
MVGVLNSRTRQMFLRRKTDASSGNFSQVVTLVKSVKLLFFHCLSRFAKYWLELVLCADIMHRFDH